MGIGSYIGHPASSGQPGDKPGPGCCPMINCWQLCGVAEICTNRNALCIQTSKGYL
jgi:hypothetical protein